MRIAIAAQDARWTSGTGAVVAHHVRHLAQRHTVLLFACDVSIDLPPSVIHRPVKAPALPGPLRLFSLRRAFREALAREAFDVLVGHGPECPEADIYIVHICARCRTAVVRANNLLAPYNRLQRMARMSTLAVASRLERAAYRACGHRRIAPVSRDVAFDLIERHSVPAEVVRVIPNGVDHSLFHDQDKAATRRKVRADLNIGDGDFVALFVGGLSHIKGFHYLVRAVADCPKAEVRLLAVGPGDMEWWRTEARALGVDGRIILAGYSEDPKPYYAAADCFVLASHSEAFSLVSLEAAAAGLPLVLTPHQGAPRELLREGENGFLVSWDPAEIAQRLCHLASHADDRHRMGLEARRAAGAFSWQRAGQELERTIEEVAERRRRTDGSRA